MGMTTPAADVSRPRTTRTPRPRRVLAASAALALLALAGACSAGSDDETSSGTTADVSVPAPASEDAPGLAPQAERAAPAPDSSVAYADSLDSGAGGDLATNQGSSGAAPADTAQNAADAPGDPRSLIKKGNVALRSDDVPTARFDVGKVVAAHGGEIAEESTQADEDGDAERVQLTLRVPVDEFDATMTGLKGVADLIDVTTDTEDVSTEVIDTDVRVELQRRSIDRISILLDNAADLRDIVSIERELSRREADLGSLEKRQKFLADQTALATITLSIEPPREEKKQDEVVEEDEDGFLAGLDGGWTALKDVTTGLLTVGGAVLPFALVVLVLAVPGRLLVRRFAPRPQGSTPAAAGPPPATA